MANLNEVELSNFLYFLPDDNLTIDILIPSLKRANKYDCMSGFFQSSSLRDLAPGLADFINKNNSRMRLIVSPFLSKEDQEAINKGISSPEEIITRDFLDKIGRLELDSDLLINHTLECLAYLISVGKIQIKVATVKNGLFHPKIKLLVDNVGYKIAVHGSNNFTSSGLIHNFEQINVNANWISKDHAKTIRQLEDKFFELWESKHHDLINVFDLPTAIQEKIVKDFNPGYPPSPIDYQHAVQKNSVQEKGIVYNTRETKEFKIPDKINFKTGDFSHQGEAVEGWERNQRRGILQMATGSGKTITSFIAANRLFNVVGKLLIVISVPYLPLMNQWEKVAKEFNLEPNILNNSRKNYSDLEKCLRKLKYGSKNVECVIITNYLLKEEKFHKILGANSSINTLLIADEVHNLGTETFTSNPPKIIDYRLGLSATPIRQYDEEGTEKLKDFFGPIVYEFGMKQAIGKCLVPYDYHVHKVGLTEYEIDQWIKKTEELKKYSWMGDESSSDPPTFISKLLNERRRILELADGKIAAFKDVFSKLDLSTLSHTLVYASSKKREQLEKVNKILMDDFNLLIHQVTGKETSKGSLAQDVLDDFAGGTGIKVITAMKVLDEGIDLPQVKRAFILASTTVEREWIQRRGRVLRKVKGKEKAVIHDFFVTPPDHLENGSLVNDIKPILKAEINRITEFAKLAKNATAKNGPFQTIEPIVQKYF
jgi:superfamily II DNA or RNA helicase/HKD family nuclease